MNSILKRLIVGGFEGVFEFAKDFRNEGMDRTHNPEFTVMELYVAYKDYFWMMETTEALLEENCYGCSRENFSTSWELTKSILNLPIQEFPF